MLQTSRKKTLILIAAGIAILILIIQMQNRRMQQLESFEDKTQMIQELQKTQPSNPQQIPTH